ncbi:uncharacterized protein B0H64DRAFT_478767 [Chaetomium fimeti]|uniref:Uncharacterized protein n=1 Tax=Chaetomium fimeti TaxID=1854472 RepID=A0AAE0H6K1_9PEZI|nr:hypothetical protein B0H64DRAFT_478767 [Chaetomium fimeti]
MHKSRIFKQAIRLFLLLSTANPPGALGLQERRDLCGLSMHTSEIPDIGNFSVIDASWTVPVVITREDDTAKDAPYVSQGVALCCGDDCSTRLSAGMWVYERSPEGKHAGFAMFQLSPTFGTFLIPHEHQLYLNDGDILWTRAEILGPNLAQLTFSKVVNETSNITLSVDLGIGIRDSMTILSIATRGNGAELHHTQFPRHKFDPKPEFCGDSAWWYLSDNFDVGEQTDRPMGLSRFSPVLVADHGLQTTDKKSFPARLPVSGLGRFWNMVRDTGGQTEALCAATEFEGTGMTLFYAL